MRIISLIAVLSASPAFADVPVVVADIAPVHSLVSQVMEGVGEPELLLPPEVSPHDLSLRPSQALALQRADAVFWVGRDLTPWLAGAIGSLGADATSVELLDLEGTIERVAEADGHDHGHDDDHHGTDPHAWLSPENARVWVRAIAAELATIDPANADIYQENAQSALHRLDQLDADLIERLSALKNLNFIVFHDAYGYFEDHFDLRSLGAVALSDADTPGAAHMSELQHIARSHEIDCYFSEPQFDAKLISVLSETLAGLSDAPLIQLDPIGFDLQTGANLYPDLLNQMAGAFEKCAS